VKIEGIMFAAGAAFFFPVAGIYWLLSEDTVGTTCLVFTGFLALLVGGYLMATARRMEPRPEDRGDADVHEGSGDVGFFSPGSWWPFAMAATTCIVGIGLAYTMIWLSLIGTGLLLISIVGLLFEYHVGLGRGGEQVARH
jgi:hypothetical protein